MRRRLIGPLCRRPCLVSNVVEQISNVEFDPQKIFTFESQVFAFLWTDMHASGTPKQKSSRPCRRVVPSTPTNAKGRHDHFPKEHACINLGRRGAMLSSRSGSRVQRPSTLFGAIKRGQPRIGESFSLTRSRGNAPHRTRRDAVCALPLSQIGRLAGGEKKVKGIRGVKYGRMTRKKEKN